MAPDRHNDGDATTAVRAGSAANEMGCSTMIAPLTPLELEGWLEFNAWRTGLKAMRFSTAQADGPAVRAVFYLDRRGRLRLPPNNPYMPVVFHSERERPSGRTADWLSVAAGLVDEMVRRGTGSQLYLPPEVEDVRPWLWRGFMVGPRFTYYLDFPFDRAAMDRTTRHSCDRATKLGLTVERVVDCGPVLECLQETAARAGFPLELGKRELQTARELLGDESLRMYVCFTPSGQAASSTIVIHSPGARAIGWIFGTRTERLGDGAGQLLLLSTLGDLETAGAIGIDLCGANIESIALFKSRWGTRLVPNYGVRTHSLRAGAKFMADWLHSSRLGRAG